MPHTTSDFLIERLGQWGVKRIYGYPGDGINGIMGALDRAGEAQEIGHFHDFPYAEFAQSLGFLGIRGKRPEGVGTAWDQALAADHPSLLEFHTDPDVPPLPPHITLEEAKKFMTSLLHDPSRSHILKEAMKEMFAAIRK